MRYFLGFLACVALIVVVFILVLRGLTGHRTPQNQTVLTDYTSTNTAMRFTIDGPITAEQTHKRIRITVSRSESRIEIMQGYLETVVAAQSYPGNEEAYGNFLRSLQLLGYTKGDPDPEKTDERGYCPTTRRYVYEIVSGTTNLQRFWKGACGPGTFKGDSARVRTLFIQQIPDYPKLTSGSGL